MTSEMTSTLWTSIGGIEVKRLVHLPRFFLLAFEARKAALAMEDCTAVDLFRRDRVFFVMSVWTSPVAMKSFGMSGIHARIMTEDASMFRSSFNTVLQSSEPPSRDVAVAHWTKMQVARTP